MFNAEKPSLNELPTSAQLIRSTAIAAASAVAILVTVVLPAEYDIDPTGIGGVLGLAEMGEIKSQLAAEAEADRIKALEEQGALVTQEQSSLMNDIFSVFVGAAHAEEVPSEPVQEWRDEITFTLAPGESAEWKLFLGDGIDLRTGPVGRIRKVQQLSDRLQREAELAGMADEGEAVQFGIAIPPLAAFGPAGFRH